MFCACLMVNEVVFGHDRLKFGMPQVEGKGSCVVVFYAGDVEQDRGEGKSLGVTIGCRKGEQRYASNN